MAGHPTAAQPPAQPAPTECRGDIPAGMATDHGLLAIRASQVSLKWDSQVESVMREQLQTADFKQLLKISKPRLRAGCRTCPFHHRYSCTTVVVMSACVHCLQSLKLALLAGSDTQASLAEYACRLCRTLHLCMYVQPPSSSMEHATYVTTRLASVPCLEVGP